jgi:hypothetical protein
MFGHGTSSFSPCHCILHKVESLIMELSDLKVIISLFFNLCITNDSNYLNT